MNTTKHEYHWNRDQKQIQYYPNDSIIQTVRLTENMHFLVAFL